jgi:hypothetical protein
VVEKGVGQLAHELVDAGGIVLLAAVAVLLQIRVSGEVVEAIDLGLAASGSKGVAVSGDGEGYVSLAGFNDHLGKVAALIALVEDEADGLRGGIGCEAFGDGAADQRGGIDGGERNGLGAGQRREEEREHGARQQGSKSGPDSADWQAMHAD